MAGQVAALRTEITTVAAAARPVTDGRGRAAAPSPPGAVPARSRPGSPSPAAARRRHRRYGLRVPRRRRPGRVLGERAGRRGRGDRGTRATAGTPTSIAPSEPAASGSASPSGAGSCRDPVRPAALRHPTGPWPRSNRSQLLALEVARRALADAGYGDARVRPVAHRGGVRRRGGQRPVQRGDAPRDAAHLPRPRYPRSWTSSCRSHRGHLPRRAGQRASPAGSPTGSTWAGANYTVDAACASSLAALDAALQGADRRHRRPGAVRGRRPAQRHQRLPAVLLGRRAVPDRAVPAVRP